MELEFVWVSDNLYIFAEEDEEDEEEERRNIRLMAKLPELIVAGLTAEGIEVPSAEAAAGDYIRELNYERQRAERHEVLVGRLMEDRILIEMMTSPSITPAQLLRYLNELLAGNLEAGINL